MSRTKIKLCGIQTIEDIHAVNKITPDYIGFVFAKSSRMIEEETAGKLKANLKPSISSVGVFVNEEIAKIVRLCKSGTIDLIQLHGDEDEGYIKSLRRELPNPIIKAVRVRDMLDINKAENFDCDYLLLDAYKKGEYGGSGVRFDWSMIPKITKPFFLAGGINSSNVLDALDRFHPYSIDVSSGVETEGRKDIAKMKELVFRIRSVS